VALVDGRDVGGERGDAEGDERDHERHRCEQDAENPCEEDVEDAQFEAMSTIGPGGAKPIPS